MSKILYITNYKESERVGYCVQDYLNDLTFYGLKELYGGNIIDSTQITHLYKENINKYNHNKLFGLLSGSFLLGPDDSDRSNIEEKIKDKYFDLIIYGSIRRCTDYFDIVSQFYPKDRVILMDGEDDNKVIDLYKDYLYFKRELKDNQLKNVKPISFSFPTKYFTTPTKNKTKKFATVIPGDKDTYLFNNQKDYYSDYKQSYFGVTTKKGGWDCMRHYEILGNYCLPYFQDLGDCPTNTMFNFPKELILESNNLVDNFDEQKYFIILDEVFKYTKKHLTTKAVAQYLINNI